MLDESVKEGSMQSPQFEETMRGREEGAEMGRNLGGPGASPMEDLMQKLADRKSRKMGIKREERSTLNDMSFDKFPDLKGDWRRMLKGYNPRKKIADILEKEVRSPSQIYSWVEE